MADLTGPAVVVSDEAVEALRSAALEIRSHISAPRALSRNFGADIALDVAAGIVERRADELERGDDR